MDGSDFLKLQYEALRQEILATQKRNFQTLGFGALSIPAAGFLAETQKIPALWLAVPVLILGIAILYLADNHGIIRCGEYIKEHIEKKLEPEGIVGWETWLERGQKHTRSTERYTTYCFYTFFLLYFLASVYMAWSYMEPASGGDRFPLPVAITITAIYWIFGIAIGYHIVRSIRLGDRKYIEALKSMRCSWSLLLLLAATACASVPSTPARPRPVPDQEIAETDGRVRLAREEWFLKRRQEPDGTVPVDAFGLAQERWRAWAPGHGAGKAAAASPFDGRTWQEIGPRNIAGRVLSVAFDPNDPDVLWAGSAGGGLYRSGDFGGAGGRWAATTCRASGSARSRSIPRIPRSSTWGPATPTPTCTASEGSAAC